MGTEWALTRALERAAALAGQGLDSQAFRTAALGILTAAVPHDAWVWPMTDPVTQVGIAPMAKVPCTRELPLLIRLKYTTPVNRWTALPTGPPRAVSLQGATSGDPARSALWDGILRRYGVGDVLSVAFADKWGTWGWLDLWRGQDMPPFTAGEAGFLTALATVLTTGLRDCSAREFLLAGSDRKAKPGSYHRQALLVVSEDLLVAGETNSARLWLDLLQPGPRPFQTVPAEVLNVAAQLLAVESGVDGHPAGSCVHVGSGVWAKLAAARMQSADGPLGQLVVTIQDCLPAERMAVFERCFALSPRECQLLELAAAGLNTAALAHAVAISSYTVQDVFKSLFGKCHVQSRAALLALALGPLA
ncbi:MAG: LuxR C-terminal-related transcriptional regulator [Specibacter sp.]